MEALEAPGSDSKADAKPKRTAALGVQAALNALHQGPLKVWETPGVRGLTESQKHAKRQARLRAVKAEAKVKPEPHPKAQAKPAVAGDPQDTAPLPTLSEVLATKKWKTPRHKAAALVSAGLEKDLM